MGGSYLDVGGVRRGEESSVSILDDTRDVKERVRRASKCLYFSSILSVCLSLTMIPFDFREVPEVHRYNRRSR